MGKYLTPKERAKLVIALQIKSLIETSSGESKSQWQIRELVNTCPSHQANDYNFYIDLKQYVWEHLVDEVREQLISLEIMAGTVAPLYYLLGIAPYMSEVIEQLKRLPVVVTKDIYDKAVIEAREHERSDVLSLEGSYDLAKQEAYYRLIQEKAIESGEFEGYRDYIDNYSHTEDELLKEKKVEIHKDVETYEKRKVRMGGEPLQIDYMAGYVGLSDEELVAKIRLDYSGQFDIPTKDEFERWEKTVEEERKRLLTSMDAGVLKKKENGIEAGSYYDWKDRRQKFAGEEGADMRGWNPLHESCMEIGFSDGRVVSSSLAKTGDWRQIIAATIHNKESAGYAGDDFGQRRLESVIRILTELTPLSLSEKRFDNEKRGIAVRLDAHKELLQSFVKQGNEVLQNLVNKVALIKAIEDAYFDGMTIVILTNDDKLLTVEGMKERVKSIARSHNDKIRDVEMLYNQLSNGFWDYRLADIDSYFLNPDLVADDELVTKELERVRQKLLTR